MGVCATAFDAEVAALVRALKLCALDATAGAEFRIFTDSQATMARLRNDQPGPGHEMARRAIGIARAGIHERGARVQVLWVPGHARVPGNGLADEGAVGCNKGKKRGVKRD